MKTFQRWMVIPAAMIVVGAVAAIAKLLYGDHIFGTTAAVPWGLLISGYVFFAATATGVGLISGIGHIVPVPDFAAIDRRGSFLALSLLLAGFGLIGIELGNPLNMIYILLSPNFQSGIWWMGFLYSLYMASLLLECFWRQKKPVYLNNRLFHILVLINKVAAICNLGGIFAILANRPFWYGYYLPLYMLVTAVLSGAAALILAMYIVGKQQGASHIDRTFPLLTTVAVYSLALTLLLDFWKIYNGLTASDQALRDATTLLISGQLAWQFWGIGIAAGLLLPLLLISLKPNRQRLVLAAGLILAGIFYMRLDFTLAAQIVPQVVVSGVQPILLHPYSPSLAEWALVIGAFGLSLLLYGLSELQFNLESEQPGNHVPGATHQV